MTPLLLPIVTFGDESTASVATNSQSQALKPAPSGRLGAQMLTNVWMYINFPFPKPEEEWNGSPVFLVSSGKQWDQISRGLRLDILNITQGFQFFKTNAVTATLHRANGEVVEPIAEGKKMLRFPSFAGSSYPGEEMMPQVMTYFPWGSNTLAECWIEVSIPPKRYWLEIPYGFDRNPADPLPPAMPGGPARFSAAMKSLTEHDHVVRWENVHYDLGRTHDGGELALIQSNPFDAEGKVAFYTDHGPRTVYTPRTSLRVLDADGTVIEGRCVDLHLNDGPYRRADTFDFGRHGDDSRSWGQIEITIDEEGFQVKVPSSLYKYTHGRAYRPVATDFLVHLRVGMKLGEVDRAAKNYNGARNSDVSSGMSHRYQYVFKADAAEAALQFDESDRLVSWN